MSPSCAHSPAASSTAAASGTVPPRSAPLSHRVTSDMTPPSTKPAIPLAATTSPSRAGVTDSASSVPCACSSARLSAGR